MESKERSLLISGPNAGGKTVLLKSLGLAFVLPSCGIFPPLSAESALPFAKNIFAIIGDEQSIEDGQSTFSAQLTGIKDALTLAEKEDLIIIDEILNGTDPQQASALAFTVIEKLIEKGCRVLVSTHLPDLKVSAQENGDMVNGAMGFGKDGKPSFKLEKGHPGVSYPLAVAESVGIPLEIIKKAKERLTSSNDLYHDALMELQQKADKMDEATIEQEKLSAKSALLAKDLKEKLDKTNAELEKLEREKKKALREEIIKARKEISSMLDETRKADKKEMAKKASELKKKENELTRDIRRPDSIPLEDVELGGPVWIIPFDKKATLVKVGGDNKAEVMTGGVRMTLPKSNLVGIRGGEPLKRKKPPKTVSIKTLDEDIETEIALLGFTFEEAVAKLEPFMDRHLLLGTPEVRVVHGKGILKSKLEGYLKDSSYAKSFRSAMPAQGGDGASIVELG